MAYLDWISDQALISCVDHLLNKAKAASSDSIKKFNKNVIDPFSALFQISGFDIDHDTWKQSEVARQAQKTLQNHIGDFHQNVLGSIESWENKGVGSVIDLVNTEHRIIAEVKNKYNTLSGGQLANLYKSLDGLVSPKSSIYHGYTAYYVAIIPKKSERNDKPFTPSNREKGARESSNEKIRQIDGASFYALVTRSETALSDLFQVLPTIIQKVSNKEISQEDKLRLTDYFKDAFGK